MQPKSSAILEIEIISNHFSNSDIYCVLKAEQLKLNSSSEDLGRKAFSKRYLLIRQFNNSMEWF